MRICKVIKTKHNSQSGSGDSLLSAEARLMSVSRSGFFLVDLEPLMHKIAERSRAKLRWHRSHPIVLEYGMSLFVDKKSASLL